MFLSLLGFVHISGLGFMFLGFRWWFLVFVLVVSGFRSGLGLGFS